MILGRLAAFIRRRWKNPAPATPVVVVNISGSVASERALIDQLQRAHMNWRGSA